MALKIYQAHSGSVPTLVGVKEDGEVKEGSGKENQGLKKVLAGWLFDFMRGSTGYRYASQFHAKKAEGRRQNIYIAVYEGRRLESPSEFFKEVKEAMDALYDGVGMGERNSFLYHFADAEPQGLGRQELRRIADDLESEQFYFGAGGMREAAAFTKLLEEFRLERDRNFTISVSRNRNIDAEINIILDREIEGITELGGKESKSGLRSFLPF